MESYTAFLVGLALGALVLHVATLASVEQGWRTDCEKIGYHVSASNKVYKCEVK